MLGNKTDQVEFGGRGGGRRISPGKQLLLAAIFLILFLSLDGASTASQAWEGAPPCYLPVALSLALLLWGGPRSTFLVLSCSVIAAEVNYHRPFFSWCGLPGAVAVYLGYVAIAVIHKKYWPIDCRLTTIRAVGRFLILSFAAAAVSTLFGVLTLFGDGLIGHGVFLSTAMDWYASDLIGVVSFTPFLLIFVGPRLSAWLSGGPEIGIQVLPLLGQGRYSLVEFTAQTVAVGAAVCALFALAPATPYQPMYLLFVPLIWASVRQGARGAARITVVITCAMAGAAALTHAPRGSMPHLQVAIVVLALTGLCLGAAVSEQRQAELDLRRREAALREAQRVARLGSWTLETASDQVTWTKELYRMFGLDPTHGAPTYHEQEKLFTPESWRLLTTSVESAVRTGAPYDIELQIRRPNGNLGWIRSRGELQYRSDGVVSGLCGIAQDITDRKRWEDELRSKTALLEAQLNSTIDGLLVVDPEGRRILQNQRLLEIFQVPAAIAVDQDDRFMLSHALNLVKDPNSFRKRVQYLYQHREEVSREEIELCDGRTLERWSSPVVGEKGEYYGRIWTFRDISERRRAEEQVKFLAYYDALTGLPNRTLLQDRLEKALAGARRRNEKVALLFLDLDRFKIINDSLGHSFGDLLLQNVAERLKRWAREQDTIARIGGDEFVIVITGIKEAPDVAVAAERIMDAMMHEFTIQDRHLTISFSIGVSMYPDNGPDGETLIKNADAAMYSAKESGRNNFRFFTEEMNAEAMDRLNIQNDLRLALKRYELFLQYQAQIDIHSRRLTGLEALMRWNHPELGIVPPNRFIRVAENSGMIIPIGEWVLRSACRAASSWEQHGIPPVTVAVNVSAIQFRQDDFAEVVEAILKDTGFDPQRLELELTESLLLENADHTLPLLRKLKQMGVKFAIDDFGTGYSSLSYLRRFPIDKLKIDRSFIRGVATNPGDAAITSAIISMGKSLNMKLIAEGVETQEQMQFLAERGCDEVQGYLFSEPVHLDAVVEHVTQRNAIVWGEMHRSAMHGKG